MQNRSSRHRNKQQRRERRDKFFNANVNTNLNNPERNKKSFQEKTQIKKQALTNEVIETIQKVINDEYVSHEMLDNARAILECNFPDTFPLDEEDDVVIKVEIPVRILSKIFQVLNKQDVNHWESLEKVINKNPRMVNKVLKFLNKKNPQIPISIDEIKEEIPENTLAEIIKQVNKRNFEIKKRLLEIVRLRYEIPLLGGTTFLHELVSKVDNNAVLLEALKPEIISSSTFLDTGLLDLKNKKNETPLHSAICSGNLNAFKLLVYLRSDVNGECIVNGYKVNILAYAAHFPAGRKNFYELINILYSYRYNVLKLIEEGQVFDVFVNKHVGAELPAKVVGFLQQHYSFEEKSSLPRVNAGETVYTGTKVVTEPIQNCTVILEADANVTFIGRIQESKIIVKDSNAKLKINSYAHNVFIEAPPKFEVVILKLANHYSVVSINGRPVLSEALSTSDGVLIKNYSGDYINITKPEFSDVKVTLSQTFFSKEKLYKPSAPILNAQPKRERSCQY